jgi:hypothetical protein
VKWRRKILLVAMMSALPAVSMTSCAAKRNQARSGERFWESCQEVIDARTSGEQKFVCVDTKGRRWEVRIHPLKTGK